MDPPSTGSGTPIAAAQRGVIVFVTVLCASLLAVAIARSESDVLSDADCLECHGDLEIVEDSAFLVDPEAWSTSVHADLELACADCHVGIVDYPHDAEHSPARCAKCHDEAAASFEGSIHAVNQHKNGSDGPWPTADPCQMCHGVHDVRPIDDPASYVHFRNVPATCNACHGDLEILQSQGIAHDPEGYMASVHGLRLGDPEKKPAVCTDCHGAHDVRLARDPASSINPFNIASTCGQCHEEESEAYSGSVHGAAFQRGITLSPTCTSCHGIHTIKMVPADDASPREQHLVRTTCPVCHASEVLMSEYDVPESRVRTYQASYHGLARTRGNAAVADCASCHGIHAIYPSTDPRSMVAPANLQVTCGGCHPGASEEFSRATVHYFEGDLDTAKSEVKIVVWVKRIYWGLLIGVLGGMLLHNMIIMGYHVRRKIRAERGVLGRTRFSPSQVTQHVILVTTFVILAATGFMLAYPNTWWSELFVNMGVTESIRRWVHRGAAIGMILESIYHMVWIWVSPYGRKELRQIAPGRRDVSEFIQNMRFHLGNRDSAPRFDKYDYPAKAEYWALVWGTIVMALTGVVLWFPVWATSFLPAWSVKVAEVIHLFEAWLATLAILIFHLFYVIAHPDVYPISLSMFSGRMPEDHARHHHPGWTEGARPASSEDVEPARPSSPPPSVTDATASNVGRPA